MTIPKFQLPTSSETLDQLLSAFRSKIFVPASLREAQKKLIYREKNRGLLAQNPVVVEIGDEKVTLETIDRLREEPQTRKGIHTFLDLMKQPSDWENLLPFLEGLHNAERKFTSGILGKIARRAAEAGRLDVVIECAKQVKRTGFNLSRADVVMQIFLGLHDAAMNSGWEEKTTAKSLAQAEAIIMMLRTKSHSGNVQGQQGDPRTSTEVMGVLLELAAVGAVKHPRADAEEKVEAYTQQFQAMLNFPGKKDDLGTRASEVEWTIANEKLRRVLPMWNSMAFAEQAISKNTTLRIWCGRTKEELMGIVKSLYEIVSKESSLSGETRYSRGIEYYNKLVVQGQKMVTS